MYRDLEEARQQISAMQNDIRNLQSFIDQVKGQMLVAPIIMFMLNLLIGIGVTLLTHFIWK